MSVNVAIIGLGYWGPNLLRNFFNLEGTNVTVICDTNNLRLKEIHKLYPSVSICHDPEIIFNDRNIDAVVIATPVSTHYLLAKKALLSGKHVLLEKPMATRKEHADELIQIATQKNLILMVDHTFLYHGAMTKIKQIVSDDSFGRVLYIDSTRINLGVFQNDVNVLWDLASHDLSIINYLTDKKPRSIQATGVSHTKNKIVNLAYLTLRYEMDFMAHINCSWSSPVKIRQMLIGGEHKMIVYNDIEPTDKLKVYDYGLTQLNDDTKNEVLVDYRLGDILVPKFSNREPLAAMAEDFYTCITEGKEPISSWKSGLEVVKILEIAEHSLETGGQEIKYSDG